MADDTIPRRRFLLGAGLAGTAVVTGFTATGPAAAQTPPQAANANVPANESAKSGASNEPEPLITLTATEHAFIVAAVDTLIPADELSPSGSDCGVAIYIDHQLASGWGAGAKMYRAGPFRKGKTTQGYQLALTPREFFATGIAAANEWSREANGKDFDQLAPAERVAALTAMETGKAEFHGIGSRQFFNALLSVTMEGMFSDPMYGGNRDKIGWKMFGYPGLPATYADKIDAWRNKRYVAPSQSIADFS